MIKSELIEKLAEDNPHLYQKDLGAGGQHGAGRDHPSA
jgi:hypothetical protein